jgi:hypothetical protein
LRAPQTLALKILDPLIEQTNRPSHLPKLRDRAVEKDFEG